jgi:polyhydroxybutyrate depolymerase
VATPLVIAIHGAFSTAKTFEMETGFSELGDKEGFIVIYPNGIGILGWLQHWNAGHCCGKAAADDVDDIGFIIEVITDVSRYLNVNKRRIYMVGFSNGGMFTHRFGAEHADMLAAIAPLAGSIGGRSGPEVSLWRTPPPDTTLPVILFHGQSDEKVPYWGGPVGGKPGEREYLSAQKSTLFWANGNGCVSPPRHEERNGGAVGLDIWDGCENGTQVLLYTLKDWGHVWPGRYFSNNLNPDNPMHGFDAAEIIWKFFQQHRRPNP